jgi:hypothetical protein
VEKSVSYRDGVSDCGGLKLPPAAQFNIPRGVLLEIIAYAYIDGFNRVGADGAEAYARRRLDDLDQGEYGPETSKRKPEEKQGNPIFRPSP